MKHWVSATVTCLCLCVAPLAAKDSHLPKSKDHKPGPAANVELAKGYVIDRLAVGLDFPTAIEFSGDSYWVVEAGITPGKLPTVKSFDTEGNVQVILTSTMLPAGKFEGPLTDITFHKGWLWVAHRELGVNGWLVGAISRFQPSNPAATFSTVLTNLPSSGDHSSGEIAFDAAGRGYFSQGTATNSGVVGPDNFLITGWLQQAPTFHDFAPREVTLSGLSFTTDNPLTADPTDTVVTSPYSAFASGALAAGTVIPAATPSTPVEGMIAGNGTVYSFDPEAADVASSLRLEGWGLRNPFGIGFDPFNHDTLFVANNGADIRTVESAGQLQMVEPRPIANDYDDLFVIKTGGGEEFFGWPDFIHDPDSLQPINVSDQFACIPEEGSISIPCPTQVTSNLSSGASEAFAMFELHSSANKLDISTGKKFRFVGDIFVAETGAFVPLTGAETFEGYRVVRVDRSTGEDAHGKPGHWS